MMVCGQSQESLFPLRQISDRIPSSPNLEKQKEMQYSWFAFKGSGLKEVMLIENKRWKCKKQSIGPVENSLHKLSSILPGQK